MLRARLLGPLEVELDGVNIPSPASQRPWAVFAYLALAGKPVTRGELAGRFWPDVLDQSARASVRSALWALRRQLGPAVSVIAERIVLDHSAGVWIDVREFDRLAAEDAEQALALCRGELLEGIEDEWALMARQAHRERVIELLEATAGRAQSDGDPTRAMALTRRQLALDPLDEAAARRLIARLAGGGDRAGAVRAYRELSDRLRRELGVAPSAQTRELVASLQEEARPDTPPARRTAAPALPLVGRDHETAALDWVWRLCRRGHGSVATLRGEAGLGKTRLVYELEGRAAATGGRTAQGAALDLGGNAPLSLWAELIRGLLPAVPAPAPECGWPADLTILGVELPEHFPHRGLPAQPVAPDLQRTRLFEAVVALLEWSSRDRPLLLVLEDIHSADDPSLELAGYAARRFAELPVLLLLTRRQLPSRPEVDRLEQALRAREQLSCEVDLAPLDDSAVAKLARTAAKLDEQAIEHVVASAEGNPLLALESARALARGSRSVAPSLRGLVRAALGPLGTEARELVELLAVASRRVAADELPSHGGTLDEALQTGVLVSAEGRIGFRHALLRQAAYEEIPDVRRRPLHRTWAQALALRDGSTVGRAAEIARHLRLAGADLEAVPHLVQAAQQARDLGALSEAAAYLEESLAVSPESSESWLELGEIEAWRGDRGRAEAAFDRGQAELPAGDPLVLARGWLRRARAYHGPICVPRAVRDCCARASELLNELPDPPEAELREALAARAWAEAVSGSAEEAERLLAELEVDAPPHDDLQIYDIGHARALALMRRGRFRDSYLPSIAAGEAVLRANRPDLAYGCWANAAGAAAAAGELERAHEFLDRGMAALAGRGLQSVEFHLLAARTFVLRLERRLEEARTVAESEQTLARRLGAPALLAMANHDRGLVELEAAEYHVAAQLLGQALAEEAPVSRPLTRLALAEALALSGDPDGADREVRATVLEPVRPSDFPGALVAALARVQGLVALARGDRERGRARLEEAAAAWERLSGHEASADSMTGVLADLGRPVVGLIDPGRELARTQAELDALGAAPPGDQDDALVH